jgi:hypothetical protein
MRMISREIRLMYLFCLLLNWYSVGSGGGILPCPLGGMPIGALGGMLPGSLGGVGMSGEDCWLEMSCRSGEVELIRLRSEDS